MYDIKQNPRPMLLQRIEMPGLRIRATNGTPGIPKTDLGIGTVLQPNERSPDRKAPDWYMDPRVRAPAKGKEKERNQPRGKPLQPTIPNALARRGRPPLHH